jgi:polyisoprenoid-binding protein YceI
MKNIAGTLLILAVFSLSALTANAQEYMTRTGHITFSSKTPLETIQGDNNQVSSILNSKTGELLFSLLNKSFEFRQALMQEHFNEKYMESDKFPKSTFKGKITDISKVNFSKDGTYQVEVEGDLTIHGVTKPVREKASLDVKGSEVTARSTFNVKPADYKIEIPSLVKEKIADNIPVLVVMNYKPKK